MAAKGDVKGLLKALKDNNDDVRESAAGPLGKIGGQAAVPHLIKALKDENEWVHSGASEALRMIGKTAVATLVGAAEG